MMVGQDSIPRITRTPLYQSHPANLSVPRWNGSMLGDTWVDPRQSNTWACLHADKVWPGHTVLYELHNETLGDDYFRYVGITDNIVRRFTQHRATKPWWPELTIAELTCFVNRETALAWELQTIQFMDPPYNTQGRTR